MLITFMVFKLLQLKTRYFVRCGSYNCQVDMFLHRTSFLEHLFTISNRMLHSLSLSFALLKDKVFGLLRKIYSQYKKAEKSKF